MVLVFVTACAALAAHAIGVADTRNFAWDWDVAQARLAADTGIERALPFLLADPAWVDGGVAVGPVGDRARVESVRVDRAGEIIRLSSVGISGRVRKTAWARVRAGVVPLVGSYGGGVKSLGGAALDLSGNATVDSNLLVRGGLNLSGSSQVGVPARPRHVYVEGDAWSKKQGTVCGEAFATGSVSPGMATEGEHPGWVPPEPLPQAGEIAALVELGRLQAELLEAAGRGTHVFEGDRVFTAADLAAMSGTYYVGGTAVLTGGSVVSAVAIVAGGNVRVLGDLDAPSVCLLAARNVSASNSRRVRVAVVAAAGDAGWSGTGGGHGSFVMEYGAMVASSLNGNFLRGSTLLRQDGTITFDAVAGPVRTFEILERGGD